LSVSIPNPMGINLDVLSNVPIVLSGIPDTFHIDIDKLPKIEIGKIHIGLDKVHLGIDKLQIGLDPISIGITSIPDIRVHLPAQFRVGFRLFGMEMMAIDLCGEAQLITEPYKPNPAEKCCEEPNAIRHVITVK
jgi:hypothetical protein